MTALETALLPDEIGHPIPIPALTVTRHRRATTSGRSSQRSISSNAPVVGRAVFVPLAVLMHDEAGAVNGGLWGWTVYSWLIINMLFVPRPMRHRGIGSALLHAAEREARARGCACRSIRSAFRRNRSMSGTASPCSVCSRIFRPASAASSCANRSMTDEAEAAFSAAIAHHQAGQIDAAKHGYRAILRRDPITPKACIFWVC